MSQRREKDYKCALRWQIMMEDKLLEEAVAHVGEAVSDTVAKVIGDRPLGVLALALFVVRRSARLLCLSPQRRVRLVLNKQRIESNLQPETEYVRTVSSISRFTEMVQLPEQRSTPFS
jgi:hypothetical protein